MVLVPIEISALVALLIVAVEPIISLPDKSSKSICRGSSSGVWFPLAGIVWTMVKISRLLFLAFWIDPGTRELGVP